ncbi:MAG: hypothetical protein II013_04480 [Lachnobacterium sp.]|nr:hypothetical protein [Lachnobacterium sp.]
MMELNDFLKYVDNWNTTYIQVNGEKIAFSLGYFIKKHPNNWELYIVRCVKPDNDDLIIEVRKPF